MAGGEVGEMRPEPLSIIWVNLGIPPLQLHHSRLSLIAIALHHKNSLPYKAHSSIPSCILLHNQYAHDDDEHEFEITAAGASQVGVSFLLKSLSGFEKCEIVIG